MKKDYRSKPLFALLICFSAYCSLYISRSTITVLAKVLSDNGILSAEQYGLIGSLFSAFYASGRIINGYLGDRYNPKFFIALGVFLSGMSNVLIGLIQSTLSIFIFWSISAIGQSMVWSAILVVSVSKADKGKKDIYISVLGASLAIGNIIGIILSSKSFVFAGLTGGFCIPGVVGILISIVVVLFLGNGNNETAFKAEKGRGGFVQMIIVLKDRNLKTLIVPIMINGVLKEGITLWVVSYLITAFGIDISQVAGYVFFVPLLGFVGRLTYSVVFRLAGKNELAVVVFDYIATAVLAIPLCLDSCSLVLTVICFGLMFLFISMSNISIVGMFPFRYSESKNVGLVSGSIDFFIYLGSGVSSAVFGIVIASAGYRPMFIVWLVSLVLSIFILIGCMSSKED